LSQALRAAGVDDDDAQAARDYASAEAVAAALRFARRRRIGPFAAEAHDLSERQKAIGAMIRAGHSFALARAITVLPPGAPVDEEALGDHAGADRA
jgi:regulatory protein